MAQTTVLDFVVQHDSHNLCGPFIGNRRDDLIAFSVEGNQQEAGLHMGDPSQNNLPLSLEGDLVC